jgi:small-conductance mechanosensitive channel
MIRRSIALTALVAAALSVACEKKEAPAPASEPSEAAAPVAAAPAVPAATEPVIDAATLPVEEQYEAEAEQEITAANLNQKLDELEKEISAP